MTPYWQSEDGRHVVYCGDCREVVPQLGAVDAVVTDPPYGVEFKGKHAHSTDRRLDTFRPGRYGHEDTLSYIKAVIVPVVEECLKYTISMAVIPGARNLQLYPPYADLGCFYSASGTGVGPWGFVCMHPVLYYGKDPYLREGLGSRPNSHSGVYPNDANRQGHPCAKPLSMMLWLVNRSSLEGWLVLDPFAGSGTTAVACARLGRRSISIELEPRYCDIIVRRLEDELAQPFLIPPASVKQEALFV